MRKLFNILKKNILLIKLVFVLTIFYYIFSKDLVDLILVKKGLSNPKLIILFLMLTFLQQLVGSARTKSLLFFNKRNELNLFKINNITWASTFLNCILPTSIAGEVYKIKMIINNSKNETKDNVVYTSIISKILTIIALVLITMLASFTINKEVLKDNNLLYLVIIFCGFLSLAFTYRIKIYKILILIYKKMNFQKEFINNRALHFHNYYSLLFLKPKLIVKPLIHSTILQLLNVLSILLIVFFTKEITFESLLKLSQVIPLGIFASIIPISYQGLGTGNYAFNELFKLVGIENGSDIFTIYFSLSYIFNLLGIIPFTLYTLRSK
ncbi:lysylphosphatidylglycerol synthase domain-containing protein [Halobacteriovorax sp.]|uniref:lysylphosphatidylglycerol synthase domain-containing protein n=1 Tax=Halobacteriovorax sp. TaxID=2020862 RepID=UPI003AF2696A